MCIARFPQGQQLSRGQEPVHPAPQLALTLVRARAVPDKDSLKAHLDIDAAAACCACWCSQLTCGAELLLSALTLHLPLQLLHPAIAGSSAHLAMEGSPLPSCCGRHHLLPICCWDEGPSCCRHSSCCCRSLLASLACLS